MAYVDTTQLSGFGNFRFVTPLISRVKALLAPTKMPSPPTIFTAAPSIAPLVAMPRKPSILEPLIAMPRKPSILEPLIAVARKPAVLAPLVTMPLRPTLFKPAVTTAIRLARTKILRALPVTFRPNGITPALILQTRTPGGDTYKTTQVEVVPGADPVSASITGAGAPMTGQSISLKETDPIIPLTATRQGVTITDETEPAMPTFVEAAALEPSPFMKYGLLALGVYILYDTFVKSKPKAGKRRRRRRR